MKNNHSRRRTSPSASVLAAVCLLVPGSQAWKLRKLQETFVGPGVVECTMGECEFSVASGLGCVDPCHTSHIHHMYHYAFEDVADVSGDFRLRGASNDGIVGDPCFHRHAVDIDAYYPDQYVEIEEGCTARCTGCTFAPTIEISGPGVLDCQNGRCTEYTTNNDFDCGDAIELASDAWGSFSTLLDGDNTVHHLHGYEGINTLAPIEIPEECTLDCSGCTFQPVV